MKAFKIPIHHPVHGDMHVYGDVGLKEGVRITHYGHGGDIVPASEAHGDHEGGVSEKHQGEIKAKAMEWGAGDHSAKPTHPLGKNMACSEDGKMDKMMYSEDKAEASDMPKDLKKESKKGKMAKSEFDAREVAVALAEKLVRLAENLEKKELTATGREHIKEDNFALPGDRYPIHDMEHARNALARVAQHGSVDEQEKVRAAVHKKYPSLKKDEKNPDEKADAKLGEQVEHLVEEHSQDNKDAERQEGHKVLGKSEDVTKKLRDFMEMKKNG